MPSSLAPAAPKVPFAARSAFAHDLDIAVAAYFAGAGPRRDLVGMYAKAALLLAWFVGSWVVLVFVARGVGPGIVAAMSLGWAIAGIGMSVQHDANHGAMSRHAWVNQIFGATLDIMGVSSRIWRPKHNVAHHTFTNVDGVDFDLDFGALARLAPSQKRRWWHRYQHVYLWFFYGLLLPKWVLYDDVAIAMSGRIGLHRLPALRRGGLVELVCGKLFFVAWAVVVPALFHPLWQVLVFHTIATFTLGITLGTIFQLAHCTRAATFALPPETGSTMSVDFASHQLATCVDFAPRSRLLSWFCGGLNFQVEHHLFPKVSHLHYPALAPIVAATARRHDLVHRSEPTFVHALRGHVAHLRAMGRRPSTT